MSESVTQQPSLTTECEKTLPIIDHEQLEKSLQTFFTIFPLKELYLNRNKLDAFVDLKVNENATNGTKVSAHCFTRLHRQFSATTDWAIDPINQNSISQLLTYLDDKTQGKTEFEVRLHCHNILFPNSLCQKAGVFHIDKKMITKHHPSIVKMALDLEANVEFIFESRAPVSTINILFYLKNCSSLIHLPIIEMKERVNYKTVEDTTKIDFTK